MASYPDHLPTFLPTTAAHTSARDLRLLYDRLAPAIHRFLRDVLRDDALASDATQETFVRAFANAEVLADPERARPWLFGVARNVSLELRRARFRRSRIITEAPDAVRERAPAPRACPEGACIEREEVALLDRALGELSEDRRAILVLRLDHELSYEEIATAMGFSLAKVKVELHRARELLRTTLEAFERGAR